MKVFQQRILTYLKLQLSCSFVKLIAMNVSQNIKKFGYRFPKTKACLQA